ncbi:MAG: class I tRNA ligase family protein, partial [Pseudomonadota bacterium]
LNRCSTYRLSVLEGTVRDAYARYDYRRVMSELSGFMNAELSAFYFDIRKDALYCEPLSSEKRRAALTVLEHTFRAVTTWLAPVLCFTAEEAWQSRYGAEAKSVHLELFADASDAWRDETLADRFAKVQRVRDVVLGALEIERREKRIGSSLEADPVVYIESDELMGAFDGLDPAELFITSGAVLHPYPAPDAAFTLDGVSGVAVEVRMAKGTKCARSWRFTDDVGSDADYPNLSARDAAAVREFDTAHATAAE